MGKDKTLRLRRRSAAAVSKHAAGHAAAGAGGPSIWVFLFLSLDFDLLRVCSAVQQRPCVARVRTLTYYTARAHAHARTYTHTLRVQKRAVGSGSALNSTRRACHSQALFCRPACPCSVHAVAYQATCGVRKKRIGPERQSEREEE
jgi:hypothetical protein